VFEAARMHFELPNPPSLRPAGSEEEAFTGQVQGKKASDIEERFARGLQRDSRVESFRFRMVKGALPGTFGSVELDFYIRAGAWYPVQLDGDWIHKSASARAQDRMQDEKLWQALSYDNPQPISRVRGTLVLTPEAVTRVINQILTGRVFTSDTVA